MDDIIGGRSDPWGVLGRMTAVASPVEVLLASAVLAVTCLALRSWSAAALCLVGPLATITATKLVLQPAFDRPGVGGEGTAYPSTHAAAAAALLLVVSLVLRPGGSTADWLPRWVRAAAGVTAAVIALYVATALVVLRYHFVTDVVGGIAVAVAVVLGAAWALDRVWPGEMERSGPDG